MSWYFKARLQSEPVTADLTTTVVHSYKLLINNVINPFIHSLNISFKTNVSVLTP